MKYSRFAVRCNKLEDCLRADFLTGAAIPVDGGAAVVDVSGAVIGSIVRSLKERAGGSNE